MTGLGVFNTTSHARLVDVQRLWGQDSVLAWLPARETTVRLAESVLVGLGDSSVGLS